jgi:hypothetical protein
MANPDLVELTDSDTSRWLRRLVRHQNIHNSQKPVTANLSAQICSPLESGASFIFKPAKMPATYSNQKLSRRNLATSPSASEPPKSHLKKPPANLRRSLDA